MNVAFIPVRGGSKSIPLKNIKPICGEPLIYWSARAACLCDYIDVVYIATDSAAIKKTVENLVMEFDELDKIQIVDRSAESASDSASTEFAMLEFARSHEFENIILIQATSPMISSSDLKGGFELFNTNGTDSVMSVVRQKRFLWFKTDYGNIIPQNYDVYNRPRRQDMDGYLLENGAFYITSRENLLRSGNRVSGNIKGYEMCAESALELDEPTDWDIVEKLLQKRESMGNFSKARNIKMFLTDCDGCLTDGGMYYSEKGDELKKFNTRDGKGFSILREKGIITGIITSEDVDLNRRRAEKLKLDILEPGCQDKSVAIKKFCEIYSINLDNVLYIGDDINDIEALKIVGFSCCPADGMPQVKNVVDYVSKARGGEGVIREIVEYIFT